MVFAVFVEIPALAAGGPRGVAHPVLQFLVVATHHVRFDRDGGEILLQQGTDRLGDIARLGFGINEHRGVTGPGVRTEHEEPVGHAGRGHALVGLAARPGPFVGQRFTVVAENGKRRLGDIDLEAGRGDHDVGFDLAPVGEAYAVGGETIHAFGLHRHIVPGERGIVVAGEQHPLAADFVVRREFFAQHRILDRRAHVPEGELLHAGGQRRVENHGRADQPFRDRQDRASEGGLRKRQTPKRFLHQFRQGLVGLGQYVGRAALNDGQPIDLRRDRRNHLNTAGACADDHDLLAGQRYIVLPARGVHDLAGECVHAGEVRRGRLDEPAHRRNHCARGVYGPVVSRQVPESTVVVEGGVRDAHAEMQVFVQAVFLGTVLDIGLDFRRTGIGRRPVRVLLEGVGIQMRGHVAGTTRVGVVTPGAADIVCPLENDEIGDALGLETDPRVDTRKPGADDDNVAVQSIPVDGLGRACGLLRHGLLRSVATPQLIPLHRALSILRRQPRLSSARRAFSAARS